MSLRTFNWPINPTTVSSGPIQTTENGVPKVVGIDKVNPNNSVALPTQEFGRIVQFDLIEAATSNISGAPQDISTLVQYVQGIEVVNTTGGSLIFQIDGVDSFIVGANGMSRQAIALKNGAVLAVKAAEAVTLTGGIVGVNLYA